MSGSTHDGAAVAGGGSAGRPTSATRCPAPRTTRADSCSRRSGLQGPCGMGPDFLRAGRRQAEAGMGGSAGLRAAHPGLALHRRRHASGAAARPTPAIQLVQGALVAHKGHKVEVLCVWVGMRACGCGCGVRQSAGARVPAGNGAQPDGTLPCGQRCTPTSLHVPLPLTPPPRPQRAPRYLPAAQPPACRGSKGRHAGMEQSTGASVAPQSRRAQLPRQEENANPSQGAPRESSRCRGRPAAAPPGKRPAPRAPCPPWRRGTAAGRSHRLQGVDGVVGRPADAGGGRARGWAVARARRMHGVASMLRALSSPSPPPRRTNGDRVAVVGEGVQQADGAARVADCLLHVEWRAARRLARASRRLHLLLLCSSRGIHAAQCSR